jgi:hypothetical protein
VVWSSGVRSCVCVFLVQWRVQLCLCGFGNRQSGNWFGVVECAVVLVCFCCSGESSCVCVCLVKDRVESGLV